MKNAVVTGGGSGIGAAVAHRLRADGLRVATIDLNPGEEKFCYAADVTDRAAVDAAMNEIRAELGPITVLVNAAGMDRFKRFIDLTFDDWQKVVDVNLNGVFHCIQATLPDMIEAGWGRIVNISSSSTHSGQPFMAAYVAAKSAVNGLTKSLALEYGPDGITVNAVPPGFIDTPMLRGVFGVPGMEELLAKVVEAHQLGRLGQPVEIANAALFLASDEASFVTGQALAVDGGFTAGHRFGFARMMGLE